MADNITYRFIQNVGDYFPSGYFTDDFITKVQNCAGRSADDMKALCSPYVQIRGEYEEYKNFIINGRARIEDKIKHTHDWHTTLLKKLGYDTNNPYQEPYVVKEGVNDSPTEIIPVRHIIRSGERVSMLIMEMQNLITINDNEPDGLFKQQYEDDRSSGQQRYYAGQWRQVIPAEYLDREKYRFSPAIINKAITQIFLMPEERRPHYILMLAGNQVFLFDRDKWARGSYLQFSLDDLYFQGQIKNYRMHYALFHLLCCKETLAADGQTVLMDSLIEESYKNAYEVTKDLKEGVIFAVETLANEALYYWKQHNNIPVSDYTDDTFEAEVKDDCLTIIYRLLFLFYAESREELEILPVGDEVYKLGYSLESLRDLEMMRLNSQESREGYFFDDSIHHLFSLLSNGHHVTDATNNKSFRVRPIDSPLFNDKNLHHLANVRIRNIKWQEIIKALSLSKKKNYCGRISYANLCVNQLGSVYESLLAFRGFYAEEDYIEVHKANEPQDGTFLVPYRRMGDFDISEVLTHPETGAPQILPKGTFVYRLNGRDRQKSASYYTPEVLTRSTVKYTLKSIIDDVRDNKRKATELLEMKILEPAMGAAAFQNEVINQLAEAYLLHQQRQQREAGLRNWRISPDQYRNELQKVKAFIATHNVYGVDLNPTAIELGKLSLWLNVIHKDMETPFFANRICVGNAVIGAWLKVYSKNECYGILERYGAKLKPSKWWEKAPHKVKFFANRVNRSVNEVYHFLLPDANMLGVRSIKEQKKEHPAEENRMAAILKDWTAPIASYDFQTLQRLSAKIDILLKDYFTDQISIEQHTNNRSEIWDGIDHSKQESLFKEEEQAESYARKQQLFDTRYGHDNAYRKLKLAMDYWCSLWFWEYKDADSLPTRQEYWADIEALLDVDDEKLDNRTRKALERTGMVSEDTDVEYNRISEDGSQIVAKSQEEMLTAAHGNTNLFSDDDPLRLKIVCRLSERYRFFHPMLEFIEVFWLRDGFDIICGNPPWLKLEFDEQGIISEKYPEVAIRKVSAPQVRQALSRFMENPTLKELYISEQNEQACSTAFMNAYCNYPLLIGQQTNLYKCVLENTMDLASENNGYIGLLTPESIYDDPKGQPLRREMYRRLRYHFQYQNELRLFAEVHHHTVYGDQLLGPRRSSSPRFASLSNLFHPNTVDACFAHDGHGLCGGIKDENGNWNTAAHRDRIVEITDKELQVLSDTFEDGTTGDCAKLVSLHSREIISVLKKISEFPKHVIDTENIITECLHETGAVDDGIIKRCTIVPNFENYEMVYSGPIFYVSNPLNKQPRKKCVLNSDYDNINLLDINHEYGLRSNYKPIIPLSEYKNLFKGFYEGQDNEGQEIYGHWLDYYKVGFRKMVGSSAERTLICSVLPRRTAL
ncbi:MAG: type II restriction endonuclease subunit M, partial [Mediterranea sp.]|nr:type II restriction endonuclease subunit M [Mediterranea sp.]